MKMERFEIDGEDYWTTSGRQAFNFDDEDPNASMFANSVWDSINEDSSFEINEQEAINISIKDVITEKALSILLQEQSLDECVISRGLNLEKEIKLLRRQIQSTLYSPAPEATAFKLLQGKFPPFEVFKSFNEKQLLLDTVLQQYGGGDGTIGVLLFLKRTLNQENFFRVIRERCMAFEHYISFLKSNSENEDKTFNVLKQFGRHQEGFIIRLCGVLKNRDIRIRKNQMRRLIDTDSYFAVNINLCLKQMARNALKLLEFVDKERNILENTVDINSTPIEVLYACSHKYSNWKDDSLTLSTSPFRLVFDQKISPAQFEWTALNERAMSQAYADLERIFEHLSTWHPIRNKQFHISFSLETAVLRLYDLKAPTSVLYLFLSKLSDLTEKLDLSLRVQCHKATIDALFASKNLNQLMLLKDNLTAGSEEQFYCDKALKNLQCKRWSSNSLKLKL